MTNAIPLTHDELQARDRAWVGRVTFASSGAGLHGWDSISASFDKEIDAAEWAERNAKGKRRARCKVFLMTVRRDRK